MCYPALLLLLIYSALQVSEVPQNKAVCLMGKKTVWQGVDRQYVMLDQHIAMPAKTVLPVMCYIENNRATKKQILKGSQKYAVIHFYYIYMPVFNGKCVKSFSYKSRECDASWNLNQKQDDESSVCKAGERSRWEKMRALELWHLWSLKGLKSAKRINEGLIS